MEVLAATEIQVVLSPGESAEQQGENDLRARVTLRSDAGTPLADQPVVVELRVGGQEVERRLTTDLLGSAELDLPRGTLTLGARYGGRAGYAPSMSQPLRLRPTNQPTTRPPMAETVGLWPWLVSLVILAGLSWLRTRRAKSPPAPADEQARRASMAPPPVRRTEGAHAAAQPYALVLDADLALPISGARMLSPEGAPSPLSISDRHGRLPLPPAASTSAYLVQAAGYESRTVFAEQLVLASGDHLVLPLRSLRSALWERLQRTAGTAQPNAAQRSPAQWARRHGPEAEPVLSDIEQALFAEPPLSPSQVDRLDEALRHALGSARGPESPSERADDR